MKHNHTPTHYFRTLGTHPPVLKVDPGDSVSTTTLDSTGHDSAMKPAGPHGSPATGPFYVKGAEPGDVLVVRFDSIVPNRSYSYSGCGLSPGVLVRGYRPKQQRFGDHSIWNVDVNSWTATLEYPKVAIEPLTQSLNPMIGSFGVAPGSGQAIPTGTSGRHGGNMDYRGAVAGTTFYFPVFVEGGLFFLADGHAAQADGEVLGRGLEISLDVTLTFDVIKNGEAEWPRGENDDEIFTIGNGRPLDEALQYATTEMVHWLQKDFHMDELSAHMIIGQFVEYEIGNVFNAAYTIVCKLNKRHLPKR